MKVLRRHFDARPFRLLDIGAGNHAASGTKHWFPQCEYFGVDLDRNYNNDERDFEAMSGFWEMDVTTLDFASIPDDFFDALMMNQVIEHLGNGDEVLAALVPKVKAGGLVYVETPAARSLRLPSMANSLNFHDDATHRRLFTLEELHSVLAEAGCSVLRSGTRRDWFHVGATPILAVRNRLRSGRFQGPDFWDLLGFAIYVVAKKNDVASPVR